MNKRLLTPSPPSHSNALWSHIQWHYEIDRKERNFLFRFLVASSEKGENDFARREKAMNNNQLYIFARRLSSPANIEKLSRSLILCEEAYLASQSFESNPQTFSAESCHIRFDYIYSHTHESRWIHHPALECRMKINVKKHSLKSTSFSVWIQKLTH